MNKREIGSLYEGRAVKFLEQHGLKLLERNFRGRGGEIDLIALDGIYLVFAEVKYRRTNGAGASSARWITENSRP